MSQEGGENELQITDMAYPELQDRKQVVVERLKVIELPEAPPPLKRKIVKAGGGNKKKKAVSKSDDEPPLIPYVPKTDTHWDFVMKEMMWLGADFMAERKRQGQLARKCAAGIRQYHKTKESRRLRELAEAELKRRKLAGKISRELRGWWTKVERVIAYRQKLQVDEERKKAMNKQLVGLVKQTERYSESLTMQRESDEGDSSDSDTSTERRGYHMTIEEALQSETNAFRRSKARVTDYSRMRLSQGDKEFYGESTASDSGSDASYTPESEPDDETTMKEAENRELAERRKIRPQDIDEDESFIGDPKELLKLQEEMDMDIEKVIERLIEEGDTEPSEVAEAEEGPSTRKTKQVKFAETVEGKDDGVQADPNTSEETAADPSNGEEKKADVAKDTGDPGNDADDDGDASDVEDFVEMEVDNQSDGSGAEEFEADENEVDDETTMMQEEQLPREMSAKEEIDLLKRESEMSVEELRAEYAKMDSAQSADDMAQTDDQPGLEDAAVESGEDGDSEKESTLKDIAGEVQDDDEDFQPSAITEVDDETTIEAEEKLGRDMSHEEEMTILKNESEIPVEQLRAMYAAMNDDGGNDTTSDGDKDSNSDEGKRQSAAAMLNDVGETNADAEEYQPDKGEAVDDETTMEAEEQLGRDITYEEELALLKRESEMSVEELRSMYAGVEDDAESDSVPDESATASSDGEKAQSITEMLADAEEGDGDADEYEPNEAEAVDDETTLEAEEKLGRDMSYDEEISLLKRESEMSVEELRAKYASMENDDEKDPNDPDSDVSETGESSSVEKRKRESEDSNDYGAKKSRREMESETSDDGLAALHALEASAERARSTLATRPYLLSSWVKLRKYQQIGLNWLVSLQSRRLNGILADEMGLGKTLQTITLLSYLASYKGIWGPHLIVVPTSVIINWETELKRFCPALKVLCYYGSAKRRKELRTGWTKSNWYHVVITSYQLAVQDAFAFKRKRWYYLVLDEAQNIKNFQSQRWQTLINFNTQRRLLLTGTPLQNNLMELWSLLHFLMPYIFRSRKEFSYWFSNPMNNMIEGNSDRNDEVINRLHGIIRPFVLRRLKKDVETQMPGKYEHIVKCQLSRRQMTLYEEFLSRSSTRQALTKGGNFMGMMNVLMQLRKVCNHPDLFEPRSVVTPFVVPSLSYPMASCVCEALAKGPAIEQLSVNLIHPLWCGSSGLPSLESAMRHDDIECNELRRLEASMDVESIAPELVEKGEECPKELKGLLAEIQELHHLEKRHNAKFQNELNSWRCQSPPFAYPSRLREAYAVGDFVLDRAEPVEVRNREIILTPAQLLEMRKTEQQRADDMDEIIDKFVFCVPKAGARRPKLDAKATRKSNTFSTNQLDEMLLEPLEELLKPYRKVDARLSSFFPDKKLIQFDAGKLQTLAELLRTLKRGGHRALIFTQMSKMLDILEAFLNINGHTYLRLDGATGVDRRQRYMDRFNNDTKIFCFILSTRSGGLGINLTGADTVIFFDSDWNPAMDAQAQDRAHRIGQTRDVHIYRLITEHTIEENILIKAKQKRNLDIMVMDQGKFDASQLLGKSEASEAAQDTDVSDVYTKGGLRAILGVADNDPGEDTNQVDGAGERGDKEAADLSKEQMEQAMTALEDDDDVKALRGAQKEAAEELQEFDENAEIKKDDDDDDDDVDIDENDGSAGISAKKQKAKQEFPVQKEEMDNGNKNEEAEMEKEFAAWQSTVGLDASAIEASLSPTERYGLHFREEIDPFQSIFSINEYRRKMEATEIEDEIDVGEIEREKAMEERRAMDDGDLLATKTRPQALIRQRNLYQRERARLRAEKIRNQLTGENWIAKVDGTTQNPFWYDTDTGEAIWDKPRILVELEAENLAHLNGWNAMPLKPLVHVMAFLVPYPERIVCTSVCRQWRAAANDVKFVRHVYPVEMGALAREEGRREYNHYSTISEALSFALPGDTIEMADGHYWVNEPGLSVDIPVKFVGDEQNAANVVVEMSGSMKWRAKGGWVEGVTFRRPKISTGSPPSDEMLCIDGDGRVDIVHSVLDNEGSTGPVITVKGIGRKGQWYDVSVRGGGKSGIIVENDGGLDLEKCSIRRNGGDGLTCNCNGKVSLVDCDVERNAGFGVHLSGASHAELTRCHFSGNEGGILHKESGCTTSCSSNTANTTVASTKNIPGFRVTKAPNGRNPTTIPTKPAPVTSSG